MTITLGSPPVVPSTLWAYGPSVPYDGSNIGQDLHILLVPGTDSTIAAVYLSSDAVGTGSLAAGQTRPPSSMLVGYACSGQPRVMVTDDKTRANKHMFVCRVAGNISATVIVTGELAGTGDPTPPAQVLPDVNNKSMAALTTTGDDQLACSTALLGTPIGFTVVAVNGVLYVPGPKAGAACYFSRDSGVTAVPNGAYAVGDRLYWNGSTAGFQLEAARSDNGQPDVIDFIFST